MRAALLRSKSTGWLLRGCRAQLLISNQCWVGKRPTRCFTLDVFGFFSSFAPRKCVFKARAFLSALTCPKTPPNQYFQAPLKFSPFPLSPSSSFWPDSNRLRCPGTTPLKSNQAWVMRRVIGPLPLEQGQALEDVIDRDRSTMAAWCQRSGMDAHGPPAVKKTQSSSSAVQKNPTTVKPTTYAHSDVDTREKCYTHGTERHRCHHCVHFTLISLCWEG